MFALLGSGCARLGPISGATMASSTPSRGHRPGAEMSWGMVGGYYLSQSVEDVAPTNTLVSQASMWFDPGTLIGDASGLGIGARMIGGSDAIYEPMLRYRFFVDDSERVALSFVGYGTYGEGAEDGASYQVGRGGAEIGIESLITPKNDWAELRIMGGASVTGLWAKGTYCSDATTGWGRDCNVNTGETGDTVAEVTTALPAGYIGLAVDLFRGVPVLHGVRLSTHFSGGTMPLIRKGPNPRESQKPWWSFGFNVSVGLGDW